jgi:PAS domain S-box-containing protein
MWNPLSIFGQVDKPLLEQRADLQLVGGASLFFALFGNLAVFILLVAVYGWLTPWLEERRGLSRQAILGVVFGFFVYVCMHVRIPTAQGVFVDQRNAITILAGLFGGPLSAAIAVVIGAAYRAFLGGTGVYGGFLGLCLSAVAGIVLRMFRPAIERPWSLAACSAGATLFTLPGFLPVGSLAKGWSLVKAMALPFGLAIFAGVFLASLLLVNEEKRRRAEQELRISEERYRLIAENTADTIVISDLAFQIQYVSPSASKFLGYTQAELLAMPLERIVVPDSLKKVHEVQHRMRTEAWGHQDQSRPILFDLELRHKNGQLLWVEISATFLRSPNGKIERILTATRDVTERKLFEQKQEKLQDQLRQAQKMESIGRLAGGVAHDFNNLLAPILGYSEMLIEQSVDPAIREELQQITNAAEHARDLTRQLLAFGRKQILAKRTHDLRQIVAEFEPLLRRTIREEISLLVRLPQRPLLVNVDSGQIQQVLMNLTVNAQDAIAGQGTITVELDEATLDETCAGFHSEVTPGGYAALVVSDSGSGMDPATQSHLFEPFFTTKAEGRGTGLGLSTAFGIITQHGGHITVYSEPRVGSTFRVYLPIEHGDLPDLPQAEKKHQNLRGKETILVVEDNEAVRDLTTKMLVRLGYKVFSAEGAARAAALVDEEAGRVDLVLTDVVMPLVSGRELHRQLTRKWPRLKVLYMSGYSDDAIANHGVLDEGVDFIEKPFSLEVLARKLREVLAD